MLEILEKGLREIEKAIENYLNGSLSQGAAAEEAGLTTQEFHQELKRRGFALRIDVKLIEAELKELWLLIPVVNASSLIYLGKQKDYIF